MAKANNIELEKRMFFYEGYADDFDRKMNMYDTNKRIDVIFNELLTEDIKGKQVLDAGCGTGWFSKMACERKAVVTSMDLGENLLRKVSMKCNSKTVVGSVLEMPFADNSFDVVISSEVIEHLPNHHMAIMEMHRVLKPNGILVLTTPNKRWFFAIWIANRLKLRPYEGLENWISWKKLKFILRQEGFEILSYKGIHLFPFISPMLYPILDFFHKFSKILSPVMLNVAIKAKKIV